MSDGFLVLAQIQDENVPNPLPSCFFVPRWLPNSERNPFYIQRLKDKLGNRSNASSEIEFNNTQGVRQSPMFSLSIIIHFCCLVAFGKRTRWCSSDH